MPNGKNIISVSEITHRIKLVLEEGFADLWVEGEISNFKRHSSGHIYFTLKDESAQIQAVMWRGRARSLFFTPQDGMKVIAHGSISLYEVRGQYQINVAQLQPLGVGELQVAFEKLKRKLETEGLFDAAHKRPLPAFPERIGIVTSSTGAAIRDIFTVISRRFPAVELILIPVHVQGSEAAGEIASAIQEFNEYGSVDVLIVGRGGGSLEDLWAFNEEIVARAIYNSKIPVVSAVGHEIDFTIADFVADLRAPTPSVAAELIVRDRTEILDNVHGFIYTAQRNLESIIENSRGQVKNLVQSYALKRPMDQLRQFSQRVDELERSLHRDIGHAFLLLQRNRENLHQRLFALNPQAVLKRGYTIVERDGHLIGSAKKLRSGDDIALRFHDGSVPTIVK